MRRFLTLLTFVLISSLVKATDQVPDYLIYQGQKLTLFTSWGHPSPLQTYFSQNRIKDPFPALSTANYRGHIATWEIVDNKLFLVEIDVAGKKYKPSDFNIKSTKDTSTIDNKVLADWFCGALDCKSNDSYYFYVRYGKVLNTQIITNREIKKIQKISIKDTSNHVLMEKYWMLVLNQNYVSYYFRLSSKEDTISFQNKSGFFSGQSQASPLLEYYSNDNMKWPYNWENFHKNGAPNCIWLIEDSLLYLTNIRLFSGTSFFSIDKDTVDLHSIFGDKVNNDKVFADWISGIFLIKHGKEREQDVFPAYKEFTPSEFTYLRMNKGKVSELYTIPSDFDFKNIPDTIQPGLKKIIVEINSEQ